MPESIGVRLKRAREERRLTIGQASAATRIRSHYLEALEKDDLSSLPSVAQARGFLRIYADFLSVDPNEVAAVAPPVAPALAPELQPPPSGGSSTSAREGLEEPERSNPRSGLRRLQDRLPDVNPADPEQDPTRLAQTHESQNRDLTSEAFVPVRSKEAMPPPPLPPAAETSGTAGTTVKRPAKRKASASGLTKNKTARFSGGEPGAASDVSGDASMGEVPEDLKKKIHSIPPLKRG